MYLPRLLSCGYPLKFHRKSFQKTFPLEKPATYVVHKFYSSCIDRFFTTVISQPDDVSICEGRGAVFTCVLNSNIRSDDVQWYRFIKDTSTTEIVDPNGENINFLTRTIGSTTSSSLTITNAIKSYTGYFWVGTSSLSVCNASLTVITSMYVYEYNYS